MREHWHFDAIGFMQIGAETSPSEVKLTVAATVLRHRHRVILEGTQDAETYLCGSVLVQNTLLEPNNRGGYAASAAPRGGREKEWCRRSRSE